VNRCPATKSRHHYTAGVCLCGLREPTQRERCAAWRAAEAAKRLAKAVRHPRTKVKAPPAAAAPVCEEAEAARRFPGYSPARALRAYRALVSTGTLEMVRELASGRPDMVCGMFAQRPNRGVQLPWRSM